MEFAACIKPTVTRYGILLLAQVITRCFIRRLKNRIQNKLTIREISSKSCIVNMVFFY